MIDLAGLRPTEKEIDFLANPEVGGLILFSRNYDNPLQLKALTTEVRAIRPDILIAADQEGGRVQRFREGFEKLPSLQKITRLAQSSPDNSEDICFSLAWLMCTEILSVGIDLSFAPVLDLDFDQCPVVSDRSFSPDPQETIKMASAYLSGMNEAGMAATAKHFPGHGAVRTDSHLELPVDSRTLDEVRGKDMLPFIDLVREYDAVMPGHLLFPNIDPQSVGFSSFWLQNVLRSELGFQGMIFSDDLSMQGAAESPALRFPAHLRGQEPNYS